MVYRLFDPEHLPAEGVLVPGDAPARGDEVVLSRWEGDDEIPVADREVVRVVRGLRLVETREGLNALPTIPEVHLRSRGR